MKISERASEGGSWRDPPARPYAENRLILSVPLVAVRTVFKILRRYAEREVEAGMFFYGDRTATGDTVVRAVVVPQQVNRWGNYDVSAQAMGQVAETTRDTGWVNIAQLHTHPGSWVEHSPYDDAVANSVRAVSIVIPHYGRDESCWPNELGVHEWQHGYWYRLTQPEARRRVRDESHGDIALIDLHPIVHSAADRW